MLFNAGEFEQSFNNKSLKKGLRLFVDGKVLLTQPAQAGSYNFLIDGLLSLTLKRHGDKIMSYNCSCLQTDYCGHLAAALFYLQKDALGIAVKTPGKRTKAQAPQLQHDFSHLLNEMSHEGLLAFVAAYARGNAAFKKELRDTVSGSVYQLPLLRHCLPIRELIAPYLQFKALAQEQLDAILQQVTALLPETGITKKNAADLYNFYLAMLCELPALFSSRLLGDESKLLGLFNSSKEALQGAYDSGLSSGLQESWTQATLMAAQLKNRQGLEAFSFLLPGLLCMSRDKKVYSALKGMIGKRRNKLNVQGEFDKLTIIRLQLAIRDAALFNAPFHSNNTAAPPNLCWQRPV